jgi:hypothetical protein
VIVVLTADFNQEILIPLSTKLIKSSRRTWLSPYKRRSFFSCRNPHFQKHANKFGCKTFGDSQARSSLGVHCDHYFVKKQVGLNSYHTDNIHTMRRTRQALSTESPCWALYSLDLKLKLNSMALVRERTIPTERPPLVDEVSANFCGKRVSVTWSGQQIPTIVFSVSETRAATFSFK